MDKTQFLKSSSRKPTPERGTAEAMLEKRPRSLMLHTLPTLIVSEGVKNGSLRMRLFPKGTLVHFEGETCDRVEIILDGQAVVERIDAQGGLLRIAQLGSDALLGGNLSDSSPTACVFP